MSEVKNMAYWKVKNTLPGIDQNSEGNTDLPDGRSGSSPFQKNTLTNEQKLAAANRRKSDAINRNMSKYNIDKKKATELWIKQNPPAPQPKPSTA